MAASFERKSVQPQKQLRLLLLILQLMVILLQEVRT